MNLNDRITRDPMQCGRRPCIRGMRIRATDILEMLSRNVTLDEILTDYPDLEAEDIQACQHYAARLTDIPRIAA